MVRRALSVLVVAVGFAALERRALAAPLPETLAFDFSACPAPDLDANSFTRAVRAELEADGVGRVLDAPAAASDGSLTVRVACDAALTARVSLKATRTGRERREQIALGDAAPSARARALALALAELVRSSWPGLSAAQSTPAADAFESHATAPSAGERKPPPSATAATAATAAAPATPTTSKAPTPPATSKVTIPAAVVPPPSIDQAPTPHGAGPRLAAVRLAAGARLRWFVDYQSVLLGGDLGTDFRALRLRAEVLVGSAGDALGSASLGSAALCVGYRVFDWRLGALNLAAYPMASAGLTWLRGSSAQPSTRVEPATGFYGDVRLMLEASLPHWTLAPTLSSEVGRASGFVARAGDRTLGATGGFFWGASLGARY